MDITLMNNEPFKPEGYKAGIEELIPQVLEEEPIKWFQCQSPTRPVSPVEDKPLDQKHDEGRPAVGQMMADFPRALLMLAKLTSYGIKEGKAAGEWKNIPNAKIRFENALGRHNLEMHIHSRDQDSMYLHASHRAWNAMAVLELILMEQEDDNFENM
ncbi:MAG: dATP/dGTP diphosphohydrolase domain-containing protein [Bacilli bacterium]